MKEYIFLFLIAVYFCCSCNSETDKHQHSRKNVVNVQDKIKEIKIAEDDVLIGGVARLYLVDKYLIIMDAKPVDYFLHLFDKNNFRYITSAAPVGQGPGEIVMMGYIGYKKGDSLFYATDHGKLKIFGYNIDSVVTNPKYKPEVKMEITKVQFPDNYEYINDSICLGRMIAPTGNSGFNQFLGKWNINTGEIEKMKYEHPDIEKKRTGFALSTENELYVEYCSHYDLMTICDIEGNLKYNIYGPEWNVRSKDRIFYYGKVIFCKDKIVASYSGKKDNSSDRLATQLLVFDLDGNYLKTLETDYLISDYCYDMENNRIIFILDDEILQFAYLDLNGMME
ncbi:MAG: TolB-like 6-bladed beta-propeller domain-containing protein [Tannerella sp.]|jgi:hypothetical protein|nr:TolB-like 6-bladed beta-propeller domain-containing protein [Tannerella sp.]